MLMLVASMAMNMTLLQIETTRAPKTYKIFCIFLVGYWRKQLCSLKSLLLAKGVGRYHLQKLSLIPFSGTVNIWSLHFPHAPGWSHCWPEGLLHLSAPLHGKCGSVPHYPKTLHGSSWAVPSGHPTRRDGRPVRYQSRVCQATVLPGAAAGLSLPRMVAEGNQRRLQYEMHSRNKLHHYRGWKRSLESQGGNQEKAQFVLPGSGHAPTPNCPMSWVNIWAAQTRGHSCPLVSTNPSWPQLIPPWKGVTVQEAKQTAAGHGCTGEGGHQGMESDHKLCQDVLHNKKAPELPWTQHPHFSPWGGQVRLQQPTCTSMAGWCNWKGWIFPRTHFVQVNSSDLQGWQPLHGPHWWGQCQPPSLHMECCHGECIPVHTHLATPRHPPCRVERLPQNVAKAWRINKIHWLFIWQ